MKKLFLSLLTVAAAMNVMANEIDATITLKATPSNYNSQIVVVEDATLTAPDVAPMYMDSRYVAFYALNGNTECQYYGVKDLDGTKFGLKTNEDTQYTLSFSNVKGSFTIYDAVEKKYIDVVAGAPDYQFTATANKVVSDRFSVKVEPALCHQYGKLLVAGHKGESLVVTDMDDVEKINITIASNNEEVALDALEAGKQYKVILNSADAVIIRK